MYTSHLLLFNVSQLICVLIQDWQPCSWMLCKWAVYLTSNASFNWTCRNFVEQQVHPHSMLCGHILIQHVCPDFSPYISSVAGYERSHVPSRGNDLNFYTFDFLTEKSYKLLTDLICILLPIPQID